jgi:hypothetical protein
MKLILITFLITTLALSVLPTDAAQRKRFNPDGAFWIIGEAPRGFQDFGGINLNLHSNRRLPSGGVNLTNGALLKFQKLSVAQDKFTFTTFPRRGTSYRFSGRFLRGGTFYAEALDDDPVLEGTLIKLFNGKVVAEANVKFSYFGGT